MNITQHKKLLIVCSIISIIIIAAGAAVYTARDSSFVAKLFHPNENSNEKKRTRPNEKIVTPILKDEHYQDYLRIDHINETENKPRCAWTKLEADEIYKNYIKRTQDIGVGIWPGTLLKEKETEFYYQYKTLDNYGSDYTLVRLYKCPVFQPVPYPKDHTKPQGNTIPYPVTKLGVHNVKNASDQKRQKFLDYLAYAGKKYADLCEERHRALESTNDTFAYIIKCRIDTLNEPEGDTFIEREKNMCKPRAGKTIYYDITYKLDKKTGTVTFATKITGKQPFSKRSSGGLCKIQAADIE